MNKLKPDAGRIEVLRAVTLREKAKLSAAQDALRSDMARSEELRREILALQRQIDRAGGENLTRRQDALRQQRAGFDTRAEFTEQTIEISRERYTAALALQKACEAHVAEYEVQE